MQDRDLYSSRNEGDGQIPPNGHSRSNQGHPSSQTRGRAVPYPSSRSNARPTGHSGRVPRQTQAGSTHSARSTPPVRTRQPYSANSPGYSRNQAAYAGEPSAPYQNIDRYLRVEPKPKRTGRILASLVVSLGVIALLGFGAFTFIQSLPAKITLNGAALEVGGEKTLEAALAASGVRPQPGDLLAVDGSVIEAGKGELFKASVNGENVTDLGAKLASGDVIEIGNGGPLEEPSSSVDEIIPWETRQEGMGAIHLIEGTGTDGVKSIKTGELSGITAEQITTEPSHIVRRDVNAKVGDDKVIALTFDDGPWGDQTTAVLDILAQYEAKATFFVVGELIESDSGTALVKRTADEGHQVCSHSYDHADGSGQGVNLGYMSPEEQVAEVEKGYSAIEAATGAPSSRVFRTPGGNFKNEVVQNIGPLMTSEIGWNVDSSDWRKPGAGAIASTIESAKPGDVVLMHDGGGDRSQTIEALKIALPRLKEKGYKFITMDELLKYPTE